jgi:hypothetical protein
MKPGLKNSLCFIFKFSDKNILLEPWMKPSGNVTTRSCVKLSEFIVNTGKPFAPLAQS